MNPHNAWFASIVTRVLYLAVLTFCLIIGGFVLLENQELHKLLPLSVFVHLGVLGGQALALIKLNYWLALKGNNLTDATTELCLMLSGIFSCLSVLGPHMFLKQVGLETAGWWKPWASAPLYVPDTLFYFGIGPAVIFFGIAVYRITELKNTPNR